MKVEAHLQIFEDYEGPGLEKRVLEIAASQLTDAIELDVRDQMQSRGSKS